VCVCVCKGKKMQAKEMIKCINEEEY